MARPPGSSRFQANQASRRHHHLPGHLVRDHWQVETCLHLVTDRWWDEDKHYLKRPGIGPVFAMLTNAALSVLRLVQQPGDPRTKTAEDFHYSPRKTTQLLGFDRK